MDLRGKWMLLTGASSGIGAVAAEKLAAEGATVIAVARRGNLLVEMVDHITASGGSAIAIRADLSDLDEIDEVVKRVGRIDVLIDNAFDGPIDSVTIEIASTPPPSPTAEV